MRIIAIDASDRRGVVTQSVEMAADAAEAAGASVERIRLAELDIRYCSGCGMCQATGVCKIQDDLPGLAALIADSEALIIGTPSYFKRANDSTAALLRRLSGYFTHPGQLRLPGMGPRDIPHTTRARCVRRAVIITACSMPEPLATFFGYTTGPVRELRSTLSAGGIRTIGSLAVTDTWRKPQLQLWEEDKARSLGRVLAGKI